MKTYSVLFILALVAICSVTKKLTTQTKGDALKTCKKVSLYQSTLKASCQTANGNDWPNSTIDLNNCLGNDNGNFKAKGGNQGYWESCAVCSINNGNLKCTCKTNVFDDNETTIAINSFISNWDGKLACDS
jgi:hypothetical protein